MDTDLFGFAPGKKDDTSLHFLPFKKKQRRRKKDQDMRQTGQRASPPLRPTQTVKSSERRPAGEELLNGGFTAVTHVHSDDDTESGPPADDAQQQRTWTLREKLLGLVPARQRQISAHRDERAASQPSVPALNVEPATDSEEEGGGGGGGGGEVPSFREGDKMSDSDVKAGAHRDVGGEVLSPDVAAGSCTPLTEARNSKSPVGCLTPSLLLELLLDRWCVLKG